MCTSKHLSVISLLLIIIFLSCKARVNEVEIVEPDPVLADSAIASINSTYALAKPESFHNAAGAPTLWQSFEAFFKDCVRSSGMPGNSLFSKYKLIYLGPTNPRYLGTIYSKDGVVARTELIKFLTPEQLNQFVVPGVEVPPCDITTIKDQYFSLALGNIPFTLPDTAALKFVLTHQDTLINSVGRWTIDGINADNLLRFLDDNQSNPDIKFYKKVMTEKKNIIAFQVVKITGFAADIVVKKGININVNASIPVMITRTNSGKDTVLCSLKFNKTNNTMVHVQSDGQFYAFALTMQGRKLY